MSFKPTATLVTIPRSQTSFSVKDVTGTYPTAPEGYGAPGAPLSLAAIVAVWADIQNYGDIPYSTDQKSGSLLSEYIFTLPVKTGVNTIRVWYGEQVTAPWALSDDRKTITFLVAPIINNVKAFAPNGEYPVTISEITNGGKTIVLNNPMYGTAIVGTTITRYFQSVFNTLVVIEAERRIAQRVVSMPLERDFRAPLEPLMETLLLKVGADIEFSCCNWSKAHDLACLASGIIPISVSQNYPE